MKSFSRLTRDDGIGLCAEIGTTVLATPDELMILISS